MSQLLAVHDQVRLKLDTAIAPKGSVLFIDEIMADPENVEGCIVWCHHLITGQTQGMAPSWLELIPATSRVVR